MRQLGNRGVRGRLEVLRMVSRNKGGVGGESTGRMTGAVKGSWDVGEKG